MEIVLKGGGDKTFIIIKNNLCVDFLQRFVFFLQPNSFLQVIPLTI